MRSTRTLTFWTPPSRPRIPRGTKPWQNGGRYKGDGANRHFDFDRAPAAVHISIEAGTDSGIFIGDSGSKYGVTVDDTGFSLVAQCFNNVTRYYTYAAYFL